MDKYYAEIFEELIKAHEDNFNYIRKNSARFVLLADLLIKKGLLTEEEVTNVISDDKVEEYLREIDNNGKEA